LLSELPDDIMSKENCNRHLVPTGTEKEVLEKDEKLQAGRIFRVWLVVPFPCLFGFFAGKTTIERKKTRTALS
jgi:hypothetical protein